MTTLPHMEAPHEHCIALYEALQKEAVGDTFSGSISKVYKSLDISNQYYSRSIRALTEIGSIEYVQKGHHKRPTIFKLLKAPTHESLKEFDFLTKQRKLNSDTDISLRLQDIERRTQKLDIVAALHNLEKRIAALEEREDARNHGS